LSRLGEDELIDVGGDVVDVLTSEPNVGDNTVRISTKMFVDSIINIVAT